MRIFRPEIFQGNLNKNRYFEGWYFKHVSADRQHVFSIIPGIALTKNDKHAFIQVIDGITGKTANISYPPEAFRYAKNKFVAEVGKSVFSTEGISVDVDSPVMNIHGELNYTERITYPATLFSPGIMGWYSFVPFMECKHGIVSVQHNINGRLMVNGTPMDFTGGTGYIEKDWGISFPESWIWLHCNTFSEPDCSLTFSVAKIPWLGSFFIGHICFLYLNGKFYRFATYNGSTISHLKFDQPHLHIELKNKQYTLILKAEQKQAGELKAPNTGQMNRMIKESIDSELEILLLDRKGHRLFSAFGTHAGLEIIEKILRYF